jgi:hypothetical protein
VRLVRPLLAAAVMSTVFVLSTPTAGACSCATSTDQESFDRADVVFEGTVVSSEVISDRLAVWTFAVDGVYKGAARQTELVYSHPDGESCGIEFVAAQFVAVFATVIDGSEEVPGYPIGDLRSGLCDGNRVLPPGERLALDPPLDPVAPIADASTTTSTLFRPTTGAEELAEPVTDGSVLVIGFIAVGVIGAFIAARIARKNRES